VFPSWDQGTVVVVHEVFRQLTPPQQALIRTYAALAARGMRHERILTMLGHDKEADRHSRTISEAHRRMQSLDRSVLFSPDVFATSASPCGSALVDKRLFLPEGWLMDAYATRRTTGKVPPELTFHTKPQFAAQMRKTLHGEAILPLLL
jgi:hypothetical protein